MDSEVDSIDIRELRYRLITNDATLTSIDLGLSRIGNDGLQLLAEGNITTIAHAMLIAADDDYFADDLMRYDALTQIMHIGSGGARNLAEGLRTNQTVKDICLSYHNISDEAASLLAEALRHNTTARTIYLESNCIGLQGATSLAQCIECNNTLTMISLNHNFISDSGVTALAEGILVNTTLTELSLELNNIGDTGAKALAECLRVNTTMKTLSLWGNKIGNEGAIALAESLKHNCTLKKLTLTNNPIGNKGAIALREALHHNTTIIDLSLLNHTIRKNIRNDLRSIPAWNQVGALSIHDIDTLPSGCQHRFVFLLLLLNQLPIAGDLHWLIIEMLKVKDVVEKGVAVDINTWRSRNPWKKKWRLKNIRRWKGWKKMVFRRSRNTLK